jgi:hypothetical protein
MTAAGALTATAAQADVTTALLTSVSGLTATAGLALAAGATLAPVSNLLATATELQLITAGMVAGDVGGGHSSRRVRVTL